jgi:hypothetical protein
LEEIKLKMVDYRNCDVRDHRQIHFAWLDRVHMDLKAEEVEIIVYGLLR